jgi:hypothetical protein
MNAQGLGAPIDLTGHIYGRLEVLGIAGIRRGRRMWNCLCQCGARVVVDGNNLRRDHTRTCGATRCKQQL